MQNLTQSDLVFSDQANHNFSRILGALKRSNLNITNRLASIRHDAHFVAAARDAYAGRPLIANERCGSWYVEPREKAASAYFKSTDGHQGQWNFSTRRLNLHLLPLIGEKDGCIIVDSTRRGKKIPDALSKTIPIWCCVLNRVLFPDLPPTYHELHVPPNAVAASERSQIASRVPEFVAALHRLGLDIPSLRRHLRKPLRPMWITQPEHGDDAFDLPDPEDTAVIFDDHHPVVCCTSSRRVVGTEMSESGYIQGAGDDTENWAHGLTPPVFWAHVDRLLSTPEADLPELIGALVAEAEDALHAEAGPVKEMTGFLSVAALPVRRVEVGTITVLLLPKVTKPETWIGPKNSIEVGVGKGKIASRNLRLALPAICSFVDKAAAESEGKVKVLVACETGRDISVGVALAIACRCFDGEGEPRTETTGSITKDSIKVKLGRIVAAMPEANPSRATLQSVNSFLMDWRG